MGTRDPRIDAYIAKSADFAQPILIHIRETVHAACPDVTETMKWSMPHFDYKGIMCAMAAFKQHATFGFWKGALIDGLGPNRANGGDAMGQLGKITSVKDLPSRKVLTGYIKAAMRLNDEGVVKDPRRARGGAEEESPRRRGVREIPARPAPRVRRVDRRREARRDEGDARRAGRGVDRRRQDAELEVRVPLSRAQRANYDRTRATARNQPACNASLAPLSAVGWKVRSTRRSPGVPSGG
jgi:hypothetical protein